MVILKQCTVYKNQGKGKYLECWMILTHELDGPSIFIYKDSSAKKLIEEKIHVPSVAEQIRFGTTTILCGNLPETKTDPRIHSSCFILITTEKLVKKVKQPYQIWLCAPSTEIMFSIIKVLAACLSVLNIDAPQPADDELHALHRYRPRPFRAENDWEEFWDNPPRMLPSSLEKMKGMAQSVDALNAKRPKEAKNKGLKDKKTMYSSTPTLDKTPPSVRESRHSLKDDSSSSSSSSESTPRSKKHEMLVGEPVKQKDPYKVHELNRARELTEKPLIAPKPYRKYDRYSSDSVKSSPVVRRKSISQSVRNETFNNKYPVNEISDADSEVEPRIAAMTYTEIQRSPMPNGSPMPKRQRDSRDSPASILKRKPSDYESPRMHRQKPIDYYSSTSGRSTPTRTSPVHQEIVPLKAPQKVPPVAPKPQGRYVNAEVQTEPIFVDSSDHQPLINSPSHPKLKSSPEDDFERNVDKLRRMSKSSTLNHKPNANRRSSSSSSSSSSDKEHGRKNHYDVVNDSDSWEECSDKISAPKLVMNHEGTRLYTVEVEENDQHHHL